MKNNILEVNGIHTLYGESHILHGISFSIQKGETVSIMGRNGMGKSTTLKSILGIVRPRSGTIRYKGKDIDTQPTWQRMRNDIAYVPEGRGMFQNICRWPQGKTLVVRRTGRMTKCWMYFRDSLKDSLIRVLSYLVVSNKCWPSVVLC